MKHVPFNYFSITVSALLLTVLMINVKTIQAEPTASVLRGGICINEILVDPNGSNNFDTDQNGTADAKDEFVEIYNRSNSAINIGGLQLWDAKNDNWFTFPATTTLGAGNYAIIINGVQAGGTLPSVFGGNIAFNASSTPIINNDGDDIVLYDPLSDEYIQLCFNGDAADDPTSPPSGDYDGFPSTAKRVGLIEDWGNYAEGISLARNPAGDTNVVRHDTIPMAANASPGHENVPPPPNNACTDIRLTNVEILENQPVGTLVGTLSAADPNGADTHTFYRVTHPSWGWHDNSRFYLERNGIQSPNFEGNTLKTAVVFDYETTSTYNIYIRCNDSRGGSCFKEFAIHITDVNEPPDDLVLSYQWIDEESPASTTVGIFTTWGDPDNDETYTYSLVSGEGDTDNGLFTIEGDTLKTLTVFDYETAEKHHYSIRVKTADKGGLSVEESYMITVNDLNEAPTDIALSSSSINENGLIGADVGIFSAEDENLGDTHTYSLVSGEGDSHNDFFFISGDVLKAKKHFDYEVCKAANENCSYSIRVRTDDGQGGTYAKPFFITVSDVNESPLISDIPDQRTDDEIPAGPVSFTVSDPDNSPDTLSVSAESSDPALIPTENIRFDGSGANRNVTLIPKAGKSGTAVITITVSDGELSHSDPFQLSVTTGPKFGKTALEIIPETEPVSPGDILHWSVAVPNTGDRDAEAIAIMVPIPENTAYLPESAEASSGTPIYNEELNQIEWHGDIGSGDEIRITFDVSVNKGVHTGEMISPHWTVRYDSTGDGRNNIAKHIENQRETDELGAAVRVEGCIKGDADGSGSLDLQDAILVLKLLTGITDGDICVYSDANADGKIGSEEYLYILKKLAD